MGTVCAVTSRVNEDTPIPRPEVLVERWARKRGIETHVPELLPSERDIARQHPFETSPSVDFARTEVQIPSAVIRPRTTAELQSLLEFACTHGVSLTTRGGGHSAGSQTLTRGIQVDLKGLDRVTIEGDRIRAQGGCRWKSIIRACAPRGLRPAVLIGSQEPTIGGTLSVGGFGDRTHRAGLQIEQVEELTVARIDGTIRRVFPGDDLFDYVLGGRGQLGVIVEAVYRTCPLPEVVDVRGLQFPSLGAFLSTVEPLLHDPLWDGMPAWWDLHDGVVDVLAGRTGGGRDEPRVDLPPCGRFVFEEEVERVPVLAALEHDDRIGQVFASPCLEVVAARSDATRIFEMLRTAAKALGLASRVGDGVPLMMFRTNPNLPLMPAPKHESIAVVAALRPILSSPEAVAILPGLRALADDLMAEGAVLYLMSVEGHRSDFLDRQLGPSTARAFVELKRRYDPQGLLNPWAPMQRAIRFSEVSDAPYGSAKEVA